MVFYFGSALMADIYCLCCNYYCQHYNAVISYLISSLNRNSMSCLLVAPPPRLIIIFHALRSPGLRPSYVRSAEMARRRLIYFPIGRRCSATISRMTGHLADAALLLVSARRASLADQRATSVVDKRHWYMTEWHNAEIRPPDIFWWHAQSKG